MKENGYVNVELKTITDLRKENITFYVDAYQRGYRWTSSEVRALLDDIREFSQTEYNTSKTNNFYCLQPIILTESDRWTTETNYTIPYLYFLYQHLFKSVY